MAPRVLIVSGMFETPAFFAPLEAALQAHGLKSVTTGLVSNGTKPPAIKTMADDIASIREALQKTIEQAGSEGVVLLLHSIAGALGSEAMKGLDRESLKKDGRDGGVDRIVFFAAGVAPEGFDQFAIPGFGEKDDGTIEIDFDAQFYPEFSPEQAAHWKAQGLCHPTCDIWQKAVEYCGWRDVPSTYILCEEDKCVPVPFQEACAQTAGSEIVRIKAGHMAQLTQPQDLAKIVAEAVRK